MKTGRRSIIPNRVTANGIKLNKINKAFFLKKE